ncbi:hypothetical protein C1141_17185, partial [Vibrio agarivorans]
SMSRVTTINNMIKDSASDKVFGKNVSKIKLLPEGKIRNYGIETVSKMQKYIKKYGTGNGNENQTKKAKEMLTLLGEWRVGIKEQAYVPDKIQSSGKGGAKFEGTNPYAGGM